MTSNIRVGDRLPLLQLPPVDRTTLALFGGASGDLNPIHIDLDFARRAGLPDVFAQGMLGMAWLARLLTQWRPQAQLRGLVQTHFQVLLGPDSDFIPVMLYESRSLNSAQRIELAALQSEYETLWTPVLAALHASGALRAPVGLARLLMLGALNWSVQWFDPRKSATVDDLVDAALALFVDARATEAAPT